MQNQPNPKQQEYKNSITPPKKTKGGKQLSTQSYLNFAEVRNGLVIMRDGSLRMIIMCSPTNFDLKSPREKDAIEFSYQGFLNSLHFPIQICIQSRKIDLDGYLEKIEGMLSEQTNPLLAELMEDYIFNIKDLLVNANIMDKRFFVVVPYYINETTNKKQNVFQQIAGNLTTPKDVVQSSAKFEERKREIIQRTNIVAQGLASIGVRAAVLKTQEIIELFYSSYNIEEAQNQSISDVSNITAPVVLREGQQPRPYTPEAKEAEPEDLFANAKSHQQLQAAEVNNQNVGGPNQ